MALDVIEMRDSYLRTALWTATDPDTSEPLDREFDVDDFDEDSKAAALQACSAFAEAHGQLLESPDLDASMDAGQAGHDLWLTRNGHGAGFWEEEWGASGQKLTEAATQLGEANVFVGGDTEEGGSRYLYIA